MVIEGICDDLEARLEAFWVHTAAILPEAEMAPTVRLDWRRAFLNIVKASEGIALCD